MPQISTGKLREWSIFKGDNRSDKTDNSGYCPICEIGRFCVKFSRIIHAFKYGYHLQETSNCVLQEASSVHDDRISTTIVLCNASVTRDRAITESCDWSRIS